MRYLFNTKPSIRWVEYRQNIISLIQNCSKIEILHQIHAQTIRTGLIEDTFVVSRIIAFFTVPSTQFNVHYARRIFDQVHHPNLFIWNSMIRSYTQTCAPKDALLLYKEMLIRGFSPDNFTYPIVTKACSHLHALECGSLLHGQIVKSGFDSDMIIMSGLIYFYSCCARIGVARKLFDEMPERDVVAWTTMISGYAQLNYPEESFLLFDEMRRAGVKPNNVTIVSLISACGHLQALGRGKWLHSYIVENNMESNCIVANALVSMYAKCKIMSYALEVFDNILTRDVVTWNSLIGGFVQNGLPAEALRLFKEMQRSDVQPNEITVVSALSACAQLVNIKEGKQIHTYLREKKFAYDVFIGNALINMYAKCGDLDEAVDVFRQIPDRDIFSWTTMITGYVQDCQFKEALALFQEMELSGVEPNEVTLVSLLSACAQLGALDQAKHIHAYIEENNVKQDMHLVNALLDMYAKCGCIETALQIFQHMPIKDTFSWNATIGGLATHGHGREAIDLFTQMEKAGETMPNDVTFIAVLCACAHSGMVKEGYHYFSSMNLYGITPSIEHYGCMVDLLSRAGLLNEANDLIEKMPMQPNTIIWGSLLSACRVHRKVELAEKAARHILKLAPDEKGVYVLLSNIYADMGQWNAVKRIRNLMDTKGIEKPLGCSLIEVNDGNLELAC